MEHCRDCLRDAGPGASTRRHGDPHRPHPGLTWTLDQTRTQGFVIDLAVAQVEDGTFVPVLTSLPDEQPEPYAEVLLPVIDALAPAGKPTPSVQP